MPRRWSDASTERRTFSGDPSMTRRGGSTDSIRIPNFVATTTSSRRSATARPISCSFVYGP